MVAADRPGGPAHRRDRRRGRALNRGRRVKISSMPYRMLAAFTVVAALAWTPPALADTGGATRKCTITDPRIDESSGLAASRRHPGIVYTFNDSGGSPRVFALGPDC